MGCTCPVCRPPEIEDRWRESSKQIVERAIDLSRKDGTYFELLKEKK